MAQKRRPNQSKLPERIATAALLQADSVGWGRLTIKEIARKAKVKEQAFRAEFKDIWDIIVWVLARLEADTEKSVKKHLQENWRDNLFDILMTRFDLVEAHRGAFSSLPRALASAPQQAPRFGRIFYRTMRHMLKLAGVPRRFLNPATIGIFGTLYLSIIYVWREDDTPDLAKTMAAVDKRLTLFEKALEYITC